MENGKFGTLIAQDLLSFKDAWKNVPGKLLDDRFHYVRRFPEHDAVCVPPDP